MRIFDPHCHMYCRLTDDYERMAVAGITAVCEPAFWLGTERTHPESFYDYFEHITVFERFRSASLFDLNGFHGEVQFLRN